MKIANLRKSWRYLLAASLGVIALAVYCLADFSEGMSAEREFARFTPSEEMARSHLEAALQSWQKGNPPGKVPGLGGPDVVLVDTSRRPGQTMDHFAIMGEAAGEGPRCFAVRVHLCNPDEEQRLRFVVYGIDPIWVYRYEDYEMMIHWECGREEREARAAAALKKNSE